MLRGGLLMAGAALAAWYFLDPKKGAERRENVANKARDMYDSASEELTRMGKDLSDTVTDLVDKVSDQVSSLTGSGSPSSSSSDSQPGTAQGAA
jgi:gas vesicle protein